MLGHDAETRRLKRKAVVVRDLLPLAPLPVVCKIGCFGADELI